ncbi:MAG: hypothetical protein ACYTG6_09315, partial [Planctomycetota bacterium]|jgi:effector-binding domain-containing protein
VTTIHLNDPTTVEDPSALRTQVVVPVVLMGPPPESLGGGATLTSVEAAEVASMTARGAYGEADVKAMEAVMAWIGENGYEVAGPVRILYHHHPDMYLTEDLLSEVQVPVRKP